MEKIKSRWRKNYLEGDEATTNKDDNNETDSYNINANSISNHNNINNINNNSNNTKNNRHHHHHHHSSKHSTPPSYEPLTENLYLDKRKNEHSRSRKDARYMVCDCILTKEERARGVMGCLDDCLNRMLMIECGLKCTLGEHCLNKRFQKLQYAKVEVFKTRKKGWGLQAAADIPSGSFIMEYVGEVVRSKEFRSRVKSYTKQKIKHHYFMALRSDEIIDATVKGNITRFINHSCEPNCETQKWTVNGDLRIGFFTIKDLKAGDEITFDYQFQRYGRKAQKCYCETPSCRGFIGGSERTLSVNGNSLSHSENKAQKKLSKHRILVDVTIEDKINALAEAAAQGLKTRDQVVALASLSVKAEDLVDRRKLLDVIKATKSEISLRLFVDYHGLEIICLWMRDPQADCDFKATIIDILQKLPIPNKTKVVESNVYRMIERWATEEPKSIVQQPSITNDPSQSATGTIKGEDEKSQDSLVNKSAEIVGANENSNHQSSQSSTQSQEATPTDPLLPVQSTSTPNIKALANKLLKKFQALSSGFKIPRISRLQRMEMEKKMDEEVKSDETISNEKPTLEQRNPFASRNYFKSTNTLANTPASNNLVNNASNKTNNIATKRRFDSLTTNNIDLTPAPKISKEEHRQQFELNARLKDYYEMIDLLPMWPQLQGGRIMDPQSALPLLAAAAAQQQRLPTGPMPTQPSTSVNSAATTLSSQNINPTQHLTPMHSSRLATNSQAPQASHQNPLLLRHLPQATAYNPLAQLAAQQQAAAAVALQQYHSRLQLPQPSTPQVQPASATTPASMQQIHNSTHLQSNHLTVNHHQQQHPHLNHQATSATQQQHVGTFQQQYNNHLDRQYNNSSVSSSHYDSYHQHFQEQQIQDIIKQDTPNKISSTLIVLANNSIEPAHTIDDELAFSICDYVEYYSMPDKMLSIEDVIDDANPYPGSYYTTPSGETIFATVALDKRTKLPRSVILNLHIRSDATKSASNKLKSHGYVRRQSSPYSNHHGDRRHYGDRDAREKILAKIRDPRDDTGREHRRAEKRIRTLK